MTSFAFTFGVIAGKFHDSKGAVLWGLPVDLVSGISLHLLALLGVARPYKHHLQSIGTGAIATYLTLTGYRVGQRWGAGGKFLASVAGAFVGEDKPVSGGSSLAGESAADVELKKLVQGEAAEG